MKFDIIGIDMPCWDLAVNLDEYPGPNSSARMNQLSWQGGGKVSTGMVAAARLGVRCSMVGAVGDDLYGNLCVKDFQEHGIDTKHIFLRNQSTTGFSVVVSDKHTMGRSILYRPGSAESLSMEELDGICLTDAKYLFIAAVDEITQKAVKAAREAGVKVLMDADSYTESLEEFIPMTDIFVGSEFVYNELFKKQEAYADNIRSIFNRGPEIVVFTFGEKGARGYDINGYFELPAYRVEVRDTLGAGDVFHGAFAVGLLKGLSAKETTQFASAVSAIKCTRIGGRAGIPDYETTISFMQTGRIDSVELDKRVKKYERRIEHV